MAATHVLIITMRSLGDVVLSTPLIRAVRQHQPSAHLAVLVLSGGAGVLARNSDIDEVLTAVNGELTAGPPWTRARAHLRLLKTLRRGRFDLLIDLTDSDRTAILSGLSGARRRIGLTTGGRLRGVWYHTAVRPDKPRQHIVESFLQMLRPLAMNAQTDELVLSVGPDDLEAAVRLGAAVGAPPGGVYVVMHPAAWRRCPGWSLEQYGQLSDMIQDDSHLPVIMVGTEPEQAVIETIGRAMKTRLRSVAGQTTLPQLAALIKKARVFVGGNSGPMHIAAAMKTPVVALFGPTEELGIMTPWGPGHTVFCTGASRRTIATEEVYAAVREVLARPWAGKTAGESRAP